MTYARTFLFFSLFAAITAFAAPSITSVTPNTSPTSGGIRVTIKGSGFSNNCIICSPPFAPPAVSFGAVTATEVTFIDTNTLEAVVPPHLPNPVVVTVGNRDGSGLTQAAGLFTYTGAAAEGFDPLLFPIYLPPVHGQFGSEFRTTARVFNTGATPVLLYGHDYTCLPIDPAFGPDVPLQLDGEAQLVTGCSHSVGRIFWTPKPGGASIAANLRVADVTREATSHGTEIPVVRAGDFTTGAIALLGVPTDPRFRLTLRVYSLASTSGPVNIEGYGQVFLTPGRDLYEPSYAEVGDLPRTLTRVVLQPSGVPLWAFITVTNNETQQITTITPQ